MPRPARSVAAAEPAQGGTDETALGTFHDGTVLGRSSNRKQSPLDEQTVCVRLKQKSVCVCVMNQAEHGKEPHPIIRIILKIYRLGLSVLYTHIVVGAMLRGRSSSRQAATWMEL